MTIGADIVGGLAATLGTLCWVPQAVKAWRSKHTRDLSLIGYVITTVMIALWLVYGLMIWSLPIIVGNASAIVLVGAILLAKLIYG